MIAKHRYVALQPDELSLEMGDIINVFRKMADGWYHGERVCDNTQGWFPGNFTEEVNSQHVRARNLKERYRVLTQTGNYIQTNISNNARKKQWNKKWKNELNKNVIEILQYYSYVFWCFWLKKKANLSQNLSKNDYHYSIQN